MVHLWNGKVLKIKKGGTIKSGNNIDESQCIMLKEGRQTQKSS